MLHKTRWTSPKIAQRIKLIEPFVYRARQPLASFQYITLPGPEAEPPVGVDIDDSQWQTITPNSYWGSWTTDFAMRTHFTIPSDWPDDAPVALYLPLGEANDFSHPEALAYIDGTAYATCDRHHQEILLNDDSWRNGRSHLLALHGWTGLDSLFPTSPSPNCSCAPVPSSS